MSRSNLTITLPTVLMIFSMSKNWTASVSPCSFTGRMGIFVLILNLLFLLILCTPSGAAENCILTNLTGGIGSELTRSSFLPKIGADGTRISFESSRDFFNQGADFTRQIFYIDTVTNAIFPVTSGNGGVSRNADISGDGTKVVFTSTKDLAPGNTNSDLTQEMFLYDIDTDDFTQLTFSSLPSFDTQILPFADNDGSVITFSSFIDPGGNPDGSAEIFLYDTATVLTTQVTFTSGIAFNLVNGISAAGTRFVFRSRGDFTGGNTEENVEVFMYDTTTNMFTQVTNTVGMSSLQSRLPDISADGSTIVFQSQNDLVNENGDGNNEIFSYDVASHTITQITHTAGVNNIEPSVNADGSRIVFGSNGNFTNQNGGGFNQVFLYDVPSDMFTQVSMATTPGGAQFPDIDAIGGRIVFQFQPSLPFPPRDEIFVADCIPEGDSDGDGIPDDEDDCVDSDTGETVVTDGCDSNVTNVVATNGCSISDLISQLAAGAANHGQFQSAVAALLNGLKDAGIITGMEQGAVTSCAGQANIP